MLYGVSLNAGQAVNIPMAAGAGLVVLAILVHSAGVVSLESEGESGGHA